MSNTISSLNNSKNVEMKNNVAVKKKFNLVDTLWWLAGYALACISFRFLINLF